MASAMRPPMQSLMASPKQSAMQSVMALAMAWAWKTQLPYPLPLTPLALFPHQLNHSASVTVSGSNGHKRAIGGWVR